MCRTQKREFMDERRECNLIEFRWVLMKRMLVVTFLLFVMAMADTETTDSLMPETTVGPQPLQMVTPKRNHVYTTPVSFTTPVSLITVQTTPGPTRHIETFEVSKEDDHLYYTLQLVHGADAYWKDLTELKRQGIVLDNNVSKDYHIATTIKLKFTFLFYGHEIDQVTIVPFGYLYMSSFMHNLMSYSQYVAPLMAGYDLGLNERSHLYYVDSGNSLTVWWKNVYLKKQPYVGDFDFQTTLHHNGTIWFVYKKVPIGADRIDELYHHVKIGLADAFYMDREIMLGLAKAQHRLIQQYHQVKVKMADVRSDTAIIIDPLKTCITLKSCESCTTANLTFVCGWCESISRCSDGMDRKRQQWREYNCHVTNRTSQCPIPPTTTTSTNAASEMSRPQSKLSFNVSATNVTSSPIVGSFLLHDLRDHHRAVTGATIAAMVIGLLIFVFVVISWVVYAYRNPSSRLGQLCIEYRPSQLTQKFNRVFFWRSRGTGHTDHYHVSVNGGNAFI